MTKRMSHLIIVISALMTMALVANRGISQNLIINGSFESPVQTPGPAYQIPAASLAPWTTTGTTFEIWRSPLTNEASAHGLQHLEVQGGSTSVWQTVTTIAGQDYRLVFYHSPRPGVRSSLRVSLDSKEVFFFDEDGIGRTSLSWQRFATNFTATSNQTTLRFDDLPWQGAGTHIDNISIEPLPLLAEVRVSEVEVRWDSVVGSVYQVQYRSQITDGAWVPLGALKNGTGDRDFIMDRLSPEEPRRTYRVLKVR